MGGDRELALLARTRASGTQLPVTSQSARMATSADVEQIPRFPSGSLVTANLREGGSGGYTEWWPCLVVDYETVKWAFQGAKKKLADYTGVLPPNAVHLLTLGDRQFTWVDPKDIVKGGMPSPARRDNTTKLRLALQDAEAYAHSEVWVKPKKSVCGKYVLVRDKGSPRPYVCVAKHMDNESIVFKCNECNVDEEILQSEWATRVRWITDESPASPVANKEKAEPMRPRPVKPLKISEKQSKALGEICKKRRMAAEKAAAKAVAEAAKAAAEAAEAAASAAAAMARTLAQKRALHLELFGPDSEDEADDECMTEEQLFGPEE